MIIPAIFLESFPDGDVPAERDGLWSAICLQSFNEHCGFDRASPFKSEGLGKPLVFIQGSQYSRSRAELHHPRFSHSRVVIEPSARKHAISLVVAALMVPSDDLLLFMNSDAEAVPLSSLASALHRASKLARNGWLVTFSLRRGAPVSDNDRCVYLNDVDRTKNGALEDDDFGTPTGITLVNSSTLLNAISENNPSVLIAAELTINDSRMEGNSLFLDTATYMGGVSPNLWTLLFSRYEKIVVVKI